MGMPSYWAWSHVVLELGYGIEPIRFTNKHFRKRGYKSISVEFRTTKIIFIALFSFMLSYTLFLYVVGFFLSVELFLIFGAVIYTTIGANHDSLYA